MVSCTVVIYVYEPTISFVQNHLNTSYSGGTEAMHVPVQQLVRSATVYLHASGNTL